MSDFPTAQSCHLELEYWTAENVGELLHVEPSTVYGWAKRDASMPMVKIGGTVRFPRARLMEWLRSREQGRPPMRKRLLSVARPANAAPGAPEEAAP